jgi:hypothetical protein
MQSSKMGTAKEEGQYEAAIQILNTLAKEQGEAEEAEEAINAAKSLSKFQRSDFSTALNPAAMIPYLFYIFYIGKLLNTRASVTVTPHAPIAQSILAHVREAS